MSTVAKVLVVLNFLLAAVFLGSASALLGHSDNWKDRYTKDTGQLKKDLDSEKTKTAALTADNDKLLKDKGAADKLADTYKREAEAVQTQNASLKAQFDLLATAQGSASRALQIAQNTIDGQGKLIQTLQESRKTDIDTANNANDEKNAAVKMQNALEANLADLTSQLKDAQSKLNDTSLKLQRAEFELEWWRSTHPGAGQGAEQPFQQAKVLQADNTNNIVVLSIGAEDGVKVGYRYTISRGNQFVTTIEITNVQAKMAAGKATLGKGAAMPGDDAQTSMTK